MKSAVASLVCALIAGLAPVTAAAQASGGSLGPAWAQQQDEVLKCVREGRCMALSQVIPIINRRTPGQPLDAGLEPGPDGQAVYRVRWAGADGRRVDYLVDARTGRILRIDGD